MYLFFDTETTGLPFDYEALIDKTDNWPRLVQIAWQIYDEQKNLIEEEMFIVQPEGYRIPWEASDVHGITDEIAWQKGTDLETVLNKFQRACQLASILVAHNLNFDEKVLGCEYFRKQLEVPFEKMEKKCTMKSSVRVCKIPRGLDSYKWPKLIELHEKFFNEGFANAHDALADVRACARCFWELRKYHFL